MAPSQKSVLITGCSAGGIGSALAVSFAQRDLHVYATARSPAKMSQLSSYPNITLLTLDVTDSGSIACAVSSVTASTGGTLDYLVNNAGSSYVMPTLDVDMEEAKRMFDVNFWGIVRVTKAFGPLVVKANGSIVNICSISGYINAPWMSVYNASKAALTMLSETLRLELAQLGVKVVTVVTGAVDTKIMSNGVELCLPAESMYSVVEENIARRARGEDVKSRMKSEDFAEKVVGDVLSGGSGKIWRGKLASTVKYMMSCVPERWTEGLLVKGTGLDTMAKQV